MNFIQNNIAILTCQGLNEYKTGDLKLIEELKKYQINVDHVIWNQDIDLKKYKAVVVRSTWDYFISKENYNAFLLLLSKIDSMGIKIFNSYELIKWNSDKKYLKEMADKGISTISSLWVTKEELVQLPDLLNSRNWSTCVIKPAISGGGRNTRKFKVADIEQMIKEVKDLDVEQWIVQPFMQEIEDGEESYIFINQKFSHAVLKKPAKNNFLVQSFHGGTVTKIEPSQASIEKISKVVKMIEPSPLFVRVDVLPQQNLQNQTEYDYKLMEIELIEPDLFSALHLTVEEKIAEAIKHLLFSHSHK